jgi:hypothetical protein
MPVDTLLVCLSMDNLKVFPPDHGTPLCLPVLSFFYLGLPYNINIAARKKVEAEAAAAAEKHQSRAKASPRSQLHKQVTERDTCMSNGHNCVGLKVRLLSAHLA